MNPRRRKQQTVTVFDGHTHHVALCRGFRDGLPVFAWGEAPSTLLTRRQLRAVGLRPGGQDPVALLVFRHHRPYRRETVAELFSIELATPKRVATPAQRAAIDRALAARRICRAGCGKDVGYYVPTSTHQCWDCLNREMFGEVA